ncbi:protein of unknown function [Shewanella benthica]|uniref:Uncharacterized protein n=1 Tax=Shewanella benthica TaxID=43661 RepID=A0A330LY79_9GAMM|nr:protein of unknown function [Shewanella benthica]
MSTISAPSTFTSWGKWSKAGGMTRSGTIDSGVDLQPAKVNIRTNKMIKQSADFFEAFIIVKIVQIVNN